MNLSDYVRKIIDPRPTATVRGFRADRITGRTFHYRPTYPTGGPLTPGHAARLLMTDAVTALTDDQLDHVGRVLGLTATATAPADRDRVTATATAPADRDRMATATGAPSPAAREPVSLTDRPPATGHRSTRGAA